MIKAGIVGATGYTGAELVRILHTHPHAELAVATSRQYAGKKMSDIFPAFSGMTDLALREYDPDEVAGLCDVVFLALPHKLPMAYVPSLLSRGVKVVDLSADFRFSSAEEYEKAYEPHLCPALLQDAVYGLADIFSEEVAGASLVGNPGCYPTSILLPLIPLIRAGIVDASRVISDSKSGVSGAGRGLSLSSHFCEVNDAFKAYKVASHRHCPEIEQILRLESGKDTILSFVPHLIPATRGMLSTIYISLVKNAGIADAHEALCEHYRSSPFVHVCAVGEFPSTAHVKGTNRCHIGVGGDPRSGQLILVSVIDNLLKGASGQAVQNMNLMMGLDPGAGLDQFAFPV